jgi:hypothetical protein
LAYSICIEYELWNAVDLFLAVHTSCVFKTRKHRSLRQIQMPAAAAFGSVWWTATKAIATHQLPKVGAGIISLF